MAGFLSKLFGGSKPKPKPSPAKPAGKRRGFLDWLQGKSAGPTKPPRNLKVAGHHGIAAGSLKPGEQDLSAGNIAQWQTLPGETVEQFLSANLPLTLHSTNVAAAQYLHASQEMIVEFRDGRFYRYEDVSLDEAQEFIQAQSKGGAVWDLFRVRGSKTEHKKKYSQVDGFRWDLVPTDVGM